ncbi:unnamed protein product [Caenorhabditis auriculariae]|uniref:Uncharacterized protein n=1 Tax=Caenorhabditis auriculariae TaxID=2777116 RepID=A0A8S1GX55_9PELO|nr:unnamed protein product [Caenorhabditis auriculariae]
MQTGGIFCVPRLEISRNDIPLFPCVRSRSVFRIQVTLSIDCYCSLDGCPVGQAPTQNEKRILKSHLSPTQGGKKKNSASSATPNCSTSRISSDK